MMTPSNISSRSASTAPATSSSSRQVAQPETYTSGARISQTPILVTIPKFDWKKSPAWFGPYDSRNRCQTLLPLSPPMPVRSSSPLASTTSMPHCVDGWSPYLV